MTSEVEFLCQSRSLGERGDCRRKVARCTQRGVHMHRYHYY
jgi:hypothetical protein